VSALGLTKIKEAGGEETPRFCAVLTLDGVPVAHVSNDGCGGSCRVDGMKGPLDSKTLKRIEDAAVLLVADVRPPTSNLSEETLRSLDLDTAIFRLLDRTALAKKIDRACKSKTLLRHRGDDAGVYRVASVFYMPGSPATESIRKDPRVAVILNELSSDERAVRVMSKEASP